MKNLAYDAISSRWIRIDEGSREKEELLPEKALKAIRNEGKNG